MYKIKYLPISLKDLRNITDYITDILKAPKAALDFIDALDFSISKLENFPYSSKVYQPIKSVDGEYRILPVKNYLVFYVVNNDEVEIHRITYAKVNLENHLK
ncbi:type II toxin-antitoxin system RelE/ParE family toxin [Bacillaceae bacterium IKA-2]|jgi:toxin ParE1/3/4|nr:type II toxin-antitoxin system RelE/ParE family toxin [Bacillaceae bacterium IKA-2]